MLLFLKRSDFYSRLLHSARDGQISRLPNGITVASLRCGGGLSAAGAFIRAGSRHSRQFPRGISAITKSLAFRATRNFPTSPNVGDEINAVQGAVDCQTARDLVIYATMFAEKSADRALRLLADAVLRPLYTEENLLSAKNSVLSEIENEKYESEPEKSFTELRYQASYGDNGLGIRELPDSESAELIDIPTIHSYHNSLYIPERIVIAAINVKHDLLCNFVDKYFDFDTTFSGDGKIILNDNLENYTGGMAVSSTEKPRVQPGHVEFPELTHVSLGFKGFPDGDPRLYAAFVMHGVLGSGRSFSSGGPGKGLFTRLNQNVLYRYGWVNSCISEIMSFNDTGIFNIYGSCEPTKINEFLNVILEQYYSILKSPISEDELSRAKNQVLSLALSGLEQISVLLEDLGRNVSSLKKIVDPDDVIQKINSVTPQDVISVCQHMLESPPSVAAMGQLNDIADYDKIKLSVTKRKTMSIPMKFNSFPFFK